MYAYYSQQWAKLKESEAPRRSSFDSSPICEVHYRSNQELLSLSVSTFISVIAKFAFFSLLLWSRLRAVCVQGLWFILGLSRTTRLFYDKDSFRQVMYDPIANGNKNFECQIEASG